ncbi:MAG TPA: hypothetical protein DEF45_11345 [Rhodopirellula sp.]|nr:hypothetical protein [Rhodopirellula sp.]
MQRLLFSLISRYNAASWVSFLNRSLQPENTCIFKLRMQELAGFCVRLPICDQVRRQRDFPRENFLVTLTINARLGSFPGLGKAWTI